MYESLGVVFHDKPISAIVRPRVRRLGENESRGTPSRLAQRGRKLLCCGVAAASNPSTWERGVAVFMRVHAGKQHDNRRPITGVTPHETVA